QGTTLKVYLPEAPEPVTSKKGPGLPITAEPLPQGLVLVAEDDAATRSVLTRLLARAGHEVHAVERADDALAWLRGGPEVAPMAVVCDVMMPGMNGVAFAGIVQGEFPQLPVLLISGYSDVRERLDASLRERV